MMPTTTSKTGQVPDDRRKEYAIQLIRRQRFTAAEERVFWVEVASCREYLDGWYAGARGGSGRVSRHPVWNGERIQANELEGIVTDAAIVAVLTFKGRRLPGCAERWPNGRIPKAVVEKAFLRRIECEDDIALTEQSNAYLAAENPFALVARGEADRPISAADASDNPPWFRELLPDTPEGLKRWGITSKDVEFLRRFFIYRDSHLDAARIAGWKVMPVKSIRRKHLRLLEKLQKELGDDFPAWWKDRRTPVVPKDPPLKRADRTTELDTARVRFPCKDLVTKKKVSEFKETKTKKRREKYQREKEEKLLKAARDAAAALATTPTEAVVAAVPAVTLAAAGAEQATTTPTADPAEAAPISL